jgi:aromatic-L-amino-acid decarboxylase
MTTAPPPPLGDMRPEDFRRDGHRIVDWLADYLAAPERYPVLSRVAPGEVSSALPDAAPEHGESFDAIFADFERVIVPGITHWNHPGFFAYFAISGSGPGILAEMLSAGLNVQAMLWRTSPAATELEGVALGWLRQLMGLPSDFEGVIYDTASISSLHALAAARELVVPDVRTRGMSGRRDLPHGHRGHPRWSAQFLPRSTTRRLFLRRHGYADHRGRHSRHHAPDRSPIGDAQLRRLHELSRVRLCYS